MDKLTRRRLACARVLRAECLAGAGANCDGAARRAGRRNRLRGRWPGRRAAVVFLHGAFMDRRSWDRASCRLMQSSSASIRYDMRPFGESTPPQQPYSVPEDVLRLLDHLKIARAHLVGHSFGGGVAIDFALLHPDRVASLVLVSSGASGFWPPEDERKAAMAIFAAVKEGDDAIVKAWVAHPMWTVSRERAGDQDRDRADDAAQPGAVPDDRTAVHSAHAAGCRAARRGQGADVGGGWRPRHPWQSAGVRDAGEADPAGEVGGRARRRSRPAAWLVARAQRCRAGIPCCPAALAAVRTRRARRLRRQIARLHKVARPQSIGQCLSTYSEAADRRHRRDANAEAPGPELRART